MKIFFTVLYRSPVFSYNSTEFTDFTNLKKIKNESPFVTLFTGDLNGHSQVWWPGGDTTPEGREIF